jgi:hypothetical protein
MVLRQGPPHWRGSARDRNADAIVELYPSSINGSAAQVKGRAKVLQIFTPGDLLLHSAKLGKGTALEVAEKLGVDEQCDHRGLKPALILEALRGAEAPLFHGTARIWEFFRNLFSRAV